MCIDNSGSTLTTLHNEMGKAVHENFISGFSEKILWGKYTIVDSKMTHCRNFQFAVRILF